MGERPPEQAIKGPVGVTRPRSSVLPEGFSWLSVPIPKSVHAHARHMASLSNMSLKEYVAWYLRTATPRTEEDVPHAVTGEPSVNVLPAQESPPTSP